MKEIKNMLLPTLVRDPMGSEDEGGSAILLPPRYKEQSLRSSFNSSPWPIASIEDALGGEPATNSHEEPFGVVLVLRDLGSTAIQSNFTPGYALQA